LYPHLAPLPWSIRTPTARPDSDVDLFTLTDTPPAYRTGLDWVQSLPWHLIEVSGLETRDEQFGVVWSRFVRLTSGLEVEIGFGVPSWADQDPVDPGARRVTQEGCRILYDPEGLLARLVLAVKGSQGESLE